MSRLGYLNSFEAAWYSSASSIPTTFTLIDITFLVLFTFEVLLRFFADRLEFVVGEDATWNAFDTLLVLIGYATHLSPIGNLAFARIVRLARAIRMFYAIQTYRVFRGLRRMVKSVMNCMLSLVWLSLLLFIVIYMFAVYFMQGLANSLAKDTISAQKSSQLVELYGSVAQSMFTLFQAISGGMDWKDAVSPIMKTSPTYGVLFLFYILFMVFGVLNIVTGVFIDIVLENAQADRKFQISEELDKRKQHMLEFMALFHKLDINGDGILTKDEMVQSLQNKWMEGYLVTLGLDVSTMQDLYDLMDSYGSGEVLVQDFVQGCMQGRGAATSMELYALSLQTTSYQKLVCEFMDAVERRFDQVNESAKLRMDCAYGIASI